MSSIGVTGTSGGCDFLDLFLFRQDRVSRTINIKEGLGIHRLQREFPKPLRLAGLDQADQRRERRLFIDAEDDRGGQRPARVELWFPRP